MDKFNPLTVENSEDCFDGADPVIQAVQQKRQAALWEITRSLQNITYAGTGARQELAELEENMKTLIDEKSHGYKYIENYLASLGYPISKIKIVFKNITGFDPDAFLNYEGYINTPSSIPGMNYGWGKSKDKSYEFYFIMPYKHGYMVFGQNGDLQRDEVKYVLSLQEATEFLKKKVAELQVYDKVVDIKKYAPVTEKQMPFADTLALGEKSASIKRYIDSIRHSIQPAEIRAMLENEVLEKHIPAEDFQKLARHFGLINAAESDADTFEKKLFEKPINEELDEVTPQQFFDNNKQEKTLDSVLISDVVEAALNYISEVQKDIPSFTILMRSLKYVPQKKSDRIQSTPAVGDQRATEYFDKEAILSVLLDITSKTTEMMATTKAGLIIFSLENNEVVTAGTMKGEDNVTYALNEAGIEKYFATKK